MTDSIFQPKVGSMVICGKDTWIWSSSSWLLVLNGNLVDPSLCNCNLTQLMNLGCQCGAFANDRT